MACFDNVVLNVRILSKGWYFDGRHMLCLGALFSLFVCPSSRCIEKPMRLEMVGKRRHSKTLAIQIEHIDTSTMVK
jgi:hypothetical protein